MLSVSLFLQKRNSTTKLRTTEIPKETEKTDCTVNHKTIHYIFLLSLTTKNPGVCKHEQIYNLEFKSISSEKSNR